MKHKPERIKNLIIQEIMRIITLGEVKDPRIPKLMTITHITLSKDLHYCHLYFSMIGNDAEKTRSEKGLNSAAGFFQKMIGERLKLRFTPKIEFRIDEEEEKAYIIDNIISKIENERKQKESKTDQN